MKILFTSFDIWKSHHTSNSSDDLLQELLNRNRYLEHHFLRHIPVDFQLAPKTTIETIRQLNPDLIFCCGMAETRNLLSIESNGKFENELLTTELNLEQLIEGTTATEISHDAGKFVCNHLYFSVLNYLRQSNRDQKCLFIHVPLLNPNNLDAIVQDFITIVDRACLLHGRER